MIIDCHGHYTTTPPQHDEFRKAQLAHLANPSSPEPKEAEISDEEIRSSVEDNQLRVLRERGGDLMIFSPKASAMAHHIEDPKTAKKWAQVNNNLIYRVAEMFPENFAAVCQLPQTPNGSLDYSVEELRRCVEELGFVGCNLNPDPSGGFWNSKPLYDEYWFPLYEAMVELDVPAMVHVSGSCNPNHYALGPHYLNSDTTAFMQFIEGDLFSRFPTLRFVIPHGGGAVPYHWGRFLGLAERLKRPPLKDHVMGNVFFDTCVYNQAGIELLLKVIDLDNILFASEMLGAVPNIKDPVTGQFWDDTKRYIDALNLSGSEQHRLYEANVRRVYPRLDARLKEMGR